MFSLRGGKEGGSYTNQGDDLSHGKRFEEVIWRLLQILKDIVCQVKAIELTNEVYLFILFLVLSIVFLIAP